MAKERVPTRRRRSISELQRDAPGIVREASERGEVEITRYGAPTAYVISPEERDRLREAERALNRAIWAVDFKRAMEDWEAGNIVGWDEFEAELRTRFIDR